jgi:hypothetical protein
MKDPKTSPYQKAESRDIADRIEIKEIQGSRESLKTRLTNTKRKIRILSIIQEDSQKAPMRGLTNSLMTREDTKIMRVHQRRRSLQSIQARKSIRMNMCPVMTKGPNRMRLKKDTWSLSKERIRRKM